MRRGWAARSPRRCGGRWGEAEEHAARQADAARIEGEDRIACPAARWRFVEADHIRTALAADRTCSKTSRTPLPPGRRGVDGRAETPYI
jgi:hypothetical protein